MDYVPKPSQTCHFGGAGIWKDIDEAINSTIDYMEMRIKSSGPPKPVQSMEATFEPARYPRIWGAMYVYWAM